MSFNRLALLLTVLTATVALYAQPVPVGSEFQVNTFTPNAQALVPAGGCVASNGAGNFVVVWTSNGQDSGATDGVYGQRYNSVGVAQGGEFLVNQTVTNNQSRPAVAMDSAGNFVVVWQSQSATTGLDIFARRYNSVGTALSGEFLVNVEVNNAQQNAAVAMDDDGDFVIVWQALNHPTDASGDGIYARRYNNAGVAQGTEFRVNSTVADDQREPAVAMDANGNFVVVWQSANQDGSGLGIYGQRYDSGGATVGSEFAVNTVTAGDQALPSVAMDAGGAFVVVFESPDVDQKGVFARRYNSAGTPFASEFPVNTTTTGEQRFAAVGMNGAGQFVVAWASPDADLTGVFAQAYTSGGATTGSELPVNTFTTGTQTNPSVALNAAGGFVLGWQSFGQDGSGNGVYAQRYVILGPPSLALNTASADFTEDDPPVILAAASTLTATVPNLSGGFLLVEWATSIQVGDTLLVETTATVRNNGGDIEHDPSGLFSGGETVVGTVPTSGAGSGLAGAQLQISFNANCTPAIAQAVLRSVAFGSVNQDPSQALRVVQFTVDDGVASSTPVTMNLNVTSVPDAPTLTSFTLLFDLEDNPKTITYADLAAAGDQADADSAPIYFRIAALGSGTLLLNGNAALVGDDILPGDNLLWTPPADVFGTHTVASFVAWDGALASATPVDLQVSLAPVNDPPSFTHAGSVSTFAGTGPNTVAAWAGNISAGPANEAGQLLQFNVSVLGTTGTLSFVTAPAVNATTGNLTFETSGEGTAQVEVTLQDDGGGADSSAPELFTITVQGAPTVIWVNPAWAGLNYGDNPSGPATFFGVDAFATLQDAINAAQPGATILLSADTFAGATVNKSLTLQGTTGTVVRGASPALLVSSGSVVSNGIDYEVDSSPTPDDPTVLITGGDLTLSNSVVTESGSFDQAAIRLTGGAILFGAGVVLNRQGAGQLIDHQTTGAIDATGVTLQNNGAAFADNFAVEDAVFHALDSATSGLVTWVSGNVFVTTASGSIQRGIDAATAGDTVHVASGTYTGGQDINKSLTVRGPNAGTHGTSGSRVAEARVAASAILFTVSAPGVIIDGFEFYAFDTLVSRCVATSGLAFSGLDVRNNVFRRDSTTAATGFGAVFAVQVVGDGTQNVTVRRNLVTATLTGPSVTAAFSCGVLLDTTSATVGGATAADGNDIYAFEQDVLSPSAVNLTLWNNTFRGAGAEISSPMAGGLTQIQENTFNLGDPALPQSLLVKFNNTSASVLVSSNLFNNHRIGAVIAAARNVTLTGNTFNNSAAVADYTHVLFSTSWPTGGTPLPVTGCSLDLGGNTFNHVAGPTAGRALDFQNGNSASTIGAISIGASGINTFDGSLPQYIRLQTSTLVAPLFSPATNPAPADFAFNLDASNNLFDGVAPGAMTAAERTALEARVEHKVDNPVLGLVSFGFNNAPTLVGGPYTFTSIAEDNFASGGDEIDMTGILDDVDGPGAGIAVIGADNSNGEWEYSLNNGTSWTAFGTVSGTSAVLLAGDPANVRVRFVPDADFFGTASITIRGWDRFTGNNGDTNVDASQNGIGTAFSANTETVTITVNAVNDAPTFTASNPSAVNEDSGAQTVSGWASGFNPGPANESGQTVAAYIVTNVSNPGLFAVQPAVDASGNLTYTPAADAFGTSTFDVQVQDNGGTANGGVDTSAAQNFTITVNAVNDAPTFTASNPSAVNEDSGAQTVSGWASGFNPGPANESGQAVAAYIVTNVSNPGLFAVQPAVDASGTLTYTPAADAFGTSTFDVQVQDNGGTANGGVDTSAAQNFTITVNAVNDAPSLNAASYNFNSQLEDDTTQTGDDIDLSGDIIDPDGPGTGLAVIGADNSNGQWQFTLTGGGPWTNITGVSATSATLIPSGTNTRIRFIPFADFFGTAAITLRGWDQSGAHTPGQTGVDVSVNGGSTPFSANTAVATITITAVNDAPTFSASNPSAVDEDSGAQTVSGWASGFNPGPANESGQTVAAYIVTNVSNPGLFAVQPAVDASGNLTYTPAADAFGTSTFDVQVQDNGGTANGGVDTSAAQNFTITVNPVNDRPTFTGGANPPVVVQGTVAPTFTGWATGMSVGPTNEFLILGQTLTGFTVTPTGGTLLFTTPPAVSLAGDLSYTVDPSSFGTATFSVLLHDDGGTTPGFDTSLPYVLTIEVLPTPTQVYVDAAFAGLSYGDDPAGPATFYGIDAFDNVQAGIDAVALSGTVTVAAGTYLGATSAKSLTLDLSATPTLRGASPVLAHSSGTLTVIGGVLDQNTAFPTVALSGGTLILNGVTVLESSVGDFAAIEVTGGTLDISTSGGNTVRVRGIGGLLIDNNHTANISAVGAVANVWQEDATTFSTAVLADNFAIEDRVAHATDAAGRGFVLWNSGHVYVTTSSASIQRGVDAATAGDTLHVAAGEFAGVVLIDRALTVEGAGAGQDADVRFAAFTGGKASTAAETVVTAANNKPLDPNPNAEDLIRVTASNVTIDGLVIDGNNPALGASALQINGVEIHARYGITNIGATNSFNPVDNLMVRHCVLQNFGWRGVSVANNGPVTHGTVRENVIRNFRSQGVYTQTNAYLDIQDNTIDVPGSGVGLHWQNFSAGRAGNAVTHWRDNRISVGVNATGIHQNLTVGSASPLNIEGNLVNADAAATFADPFTIGINVWSLQGNTSTTLVNNIVGASGGQFARGINLWDLPTTTSLSITGGSVGNSGAGVHLDNVDLFLLQGAATHVTVSGLTVAATCETGVLLRSATVLTWDDTLLTLSVVTPAGNNVSMSMTGCTIAGSVEGIRVETDSTFTAALQLSGGSITGDLGLHVLGAQASASVSQTAITGSVFEGVLVDGGTAGISASTLSAGSVGLDLQNGGSLSVFANNTISAWGVAGIRVGATAGGIAAINDNAFTGTGLALENLSATAVNAQNNWWGSPTGPTEASNPGGTGGSVTSLALVGYTPWWASGSDISVAPGFQGGDTVFSPSGEARHAIPTELAWVQQPLSPQVALVNFVPAPALRAQDSSGYLGFNFNGSVFLGFSSNPVGATTAGGTVNALDGLVSFGSFSVSLGGVFTFQGFAVGPLGNINSPVSGLVFVNNPAPVLVSVVPDWANAGSGSILLTLTGSGFNSQSQSRWNGGNRATLYVNANTLMMALTSADLAAPGTNSIEVNNGTPGGGTSNPLDFTTNGVPSAINLTSSTVAENLPANTLVGTLSVVDAFPALDTHSLALVFGAGSSGNGSFTLVGNEVRTTASFDFEAQSSYSIRVRATDTFGAWLEAVFVISITNVNEAPVAVADTYNATEDSTLTVNPSQGVIGNDSDPDGTTPTAVLSTAPVPAAAVSVFGLNADGSFSLTPVLNFNGTITFSYHAFDGALSSAPVVVTLNFASVNDAPVAANDSYGANEDVALQVNAAAGVLANDSDLHAGAPGENNTPLTAVLVSNTSSGTISLNADGSFTYTPFANFSGADSFTYRTLDSLGAQSGVATVTINVSAVNDSPVLNAASYSFNSQLEDDTAQIGDDIDLSGDVTDVDGPGTGLAVYGADNTNGQWEFTLSGGAPWTALTGLSPATARLIPSGALTRIRFVPAADFFGAAAIQFRAWDKSTGSDGQAGVDITVHGGSTAFSANTAVATINILPVNDAPTLTTVSTLTGGVEDTAFTVFYSALAAAADEADIDSSTISFRIESVSTGSLVLNGSAVVPGTSVFGAGDQLVWTPAADANGVLAAFTVVAWDGALASATPVQVSVNVASVNDTPSFTKGSDPGVSEDSGLQTIAGWATAVSAGPADESGQSLTFVVTGNSNSALFAVQPAVSATGTLTFTPAADAFGTAQVTIVLQDNGGGADTSAPQTFVITVSAVNDAPTLTAVSTLNGAVEDTPFVIFYSTLLAQADEADIDSAPVNFRIESVTSGTLTMNGGAIALGTTIFAAGDQLEWTPAANANGVLAAFMIRAWDGALASATDVQVNVSVGAANDAPTLTTVSTLTGATEDTQFVIPFATLAAAADEADVDSSPVNFRIESVTSGTLTINSSAVTPGTTILASGDQLEWTPAANANGVLAAFTVRAWDGALASATAVQVSVNVTPVDDPPELVLPASGSSFVDLGGGVYRLTIDPGAVPSDAVLQVTDIDSASADLTVTPPASLPAGITSPATNPAVTAGALLAFTGSSSTTDPLLSPYQYTFTLVGAAGAYTVQVVVNDPPPQHSVASGFGQGSAGNPYTTSVGIGGAPGVVLANVFELNTAQTISQVSATLISPTGSPFTAGYTGAGSNGAITAQAGRTLNIGDVGNHDLSVTVTDGQTNVVVFVRVTVLNVGNVPPTSGLATGSVFTAAGANQFTLTVDPNETLADATLVLTDADGDPLTLTSVTAAPMALGGIVPPAILVTALSPLAISFTGTVDPSFDPQDYIYSLVVTDNITAPVTITVTFTLRDLAPEHVAGPDADAVAPGTGSSADPYRVTVQAGHNTPLVMSIVTDANTGQTLSLTGVNTTAQPLVAYTFALVGTGNTGDIVITPVAPLGAADVGVWTIEFFVTDGTNPITIFVEITVLPAPQSGGGKKKDSGCSTSGHSGNSLLWVALGVLGLLFRPRRRNA
ncbi:MAG: tandem-95 repeat protein [Planctomycetes bacterium]|nr:tandem-95 repeat protein [Planctomycetota bacterium]